MSYNNPSDTEISNIGLDAVITLLQQELKQLPWLNKVFHRAYTHRELDINQRTILIPKVWEAGVEWYDCRPNDSLKTAVSQSFFFPISEERVTSFEKRSDPTFEQDVALVVWLNISQLAAHEGSPSAGYLKSDVLDVLKNSDSVLDITSIVDKDAVQIYEGFTITDEVTQYTMLPYQGFRINFTVKFDYIECLMPSS
jgi:hypothetical protein